MRLNKKVAIILIFGAVNMVYGQAPVTLEELIERYPGHSEVVLNNQITYNISEKDGKLEIFQDSYFESMILNQQGIASYTERFFDSELSSIVDYEAYTLDKSNKKIKTDLAKESTNNTDNIFYDDVKEIEVTFKGLETGSRKVLQHRTKFLDPHLLHRFLFRQYDPVRSSSLSIVCDNDVEIGYIISNDIDKNIKFSKEVKRKKTYYTWTMEEVAPYKYEDNAPTILYTEPHISVFVKSYNSRGEKVAVLNQVDELYAYYADFVKNLNKEVSTELENIAHSITEGLVDEEEKVKAIYYWVKDNIKYIAYENGYEGFIPREASLICSRKFGDCKDMSSVITSMCNIVGIDKVKLCWIGTRDLPYKYAELPTPSVDNHMIAAYLKGDDIIFLDGTDPYVSYPYPSSFIQGKEALIGVDQDNYLLRTVPIVEPEVNLHHLKLDAKITSQTLTGSGSVRLTGYPRINMVSRLTTLDKGRREETLKNRINFGNNKLELTNIVESNAEDRDLPMDIDFEFQLENYLVSLGQELYFSPFIQKIGVLQKMKSDRTLPYESSNLAHVKVDLNFELEPDDVVTYLSEPFKIDSELLFFNMRMETDGRQLLINYELKNRKLLLMPDDFNQWNKEVEEITEALENNIIISRK